jgi:hypothetical protein
LFTASGDAVFYLPLDEKARSQAAGTLDALDYETNYRSALDQKGPDAFYDWRLGISATLQLVSLRMVVIAALDPNFIKDGNFNKELKIYRDGLIEHYNRMLVGIRCGRPIPPGSNIWWNSYPCADIHTGLSTWAKRTKKNCNIYYTYSSFWAGAAGAAVTQQELCGPDSEEDQEVFADLRREVIRRMPLYEMKLMIDTLYLYMNPMRDLTAEYQRLPSYVTPSLCLEAKGESDGAALQLWTCDGDPLQHWVYYRASAHLRNPDIGKCLEISYGVHASGQNFPVSISECFGDEWQRWTYDPEKHVLLSAMGTVLTIEPRNSIDYARWFFTDKWFDPCLSG